MSLDKQNLNEQLCFSYYTLYRLFNQLYKDALAEFELTYTQYLVLTILWTSGSQYLNNIGEQLDLSSNTLTPLLKRLQKKGLIERQHPKEDKRQLIISLTPLGETMKHQVTHKMNSCYQNIDGLNHSMAEDILANNNQLIALMKNILNHHNSS